MLKNALFSLKNCKVTEHWEPVLPDPQSTFIANAWLYALL